MKQLVCEMCGSTDMLKQDGVFVCQNCGTKYSVEEARKLMIEGTVAVQGTVEIQGTVKVDASDELNKLYQLARRAKEENNAADAARYYENIVIKDPNSWEATFYAAYYKAIECDFHDMVNCANKLLDRSDTVFKLIKENITDYTEQRKAIDQVSTGILKVAKQLLDVYSRFFFSLPADHLRQHRVADYVTNASFSRTLAFLTGDKIVKHFDATHGDIASACWQAGINLENAVRNYNKKLQFKELVEFNNTYRPASAAYSALIKTTTQKFKELRAKQIKEEKDKKKQEYWLAHAEEKEQLDQKLSQIKERLKPLYEQMETLYRIPKALLDSERDQQLPIQKDLQEMDKKIEALNAERAKLGIFAGKRKKQIQAELEQLGAERDKLECLSKEQRAQKNQEIKEKIALLDERIAPIKQQIEELQIEKKKITDELEKDR